jgi:hypothetical protein
MRLLISSVLVATLMMSHTALADDDAQDSHEGREWYGWQTLLADSALISAWATYPNWSGFTGDGALLFLDMMAYVAVSPVIHSVHDNVRADSVGIRIAMPFVGALLGLGVGATIRCSCGPDAFLCFCGLDNAMWGLFYGSVAGAGLASIVDAVAFSWARRKPSDAHTTTSWTIAPFGLRSGGGLSASCVF